MTDPKLVIQRDRATIVAPDGLSPELRRTRNSIAKSLSFRKSDVFFSEAYQSGRWSGDYQLYHKRRATDPSVNGTFPGDGDWYSTGLLRRTLRSWRTFGVAIDDQRALPEVALDKSRASWALLRPYQKRAIRSLFQHRVQGYWLPRGIIHLPPRTGKTVIAGALLDQLHAHRPAVFIVERIDLARQSVDALNEILDEPVGLVGDGECDVRGVTVMTIQSLYNAFNISYKMDKFMSAERAIQRKQAVVAALATCEVLIVDEAHHTAAKSYAQAVRRARNAWCVVGLSGTPWMDDGSDLRLEDVIGPIIFRRSYSAMIQGGWLLPLTVYYYHIPRIAVYSGNYQAVYKAAVVDNPVKTHVIREAARSLISAGKSVAILTVQIRHTRELAESIPGAVAITGKERGLYRQEVYRKLHEKRISCIVTNVMNEGIDVPSLDAAINADGGVDSRRVFQRLRVLTPYPGKKRGIYIDFLHEEKHLSRHAKRRRDFYRSEPGFKVIDRDLCAELRFHFAGRVAFA